ncbi:uncharacterized protein LOC132934258 isoform X2 [Metopolophium dirhodum]|uniref:uncharacterized protein LOC132934258 isoform X2 n=1 Tax=Metopolophium dirhodum TaxID=44670 RepID=UPI0029904D3B|nr:uncharacterized protein LOC132934258 isoform X2 [Metopolophium dirhodum]XP_060856531.1 uncharacterized protein LOC132934258 isoform X2 [Metopolophium dirhodum]
MVCKYLGETFYDSNLKRILDLNTSDNFNENKNQSLRFSYVKKAIELLSCLKECLLNHSDDSTDIILSAIHCATVSRCIHSVVTHGFIPCLIPSIWKSFENYQKYEQTFEKITPDTTYEELKFNVNSFFDLIKEPTLKRLILVKHTNVLLAGVCQLCLLPIAKPGTGIATESAIDELKYEQLINEQKTFKNILKNLILINRDPLFIREIIFVLGHKNCQKHIKLGLGELFSDLLIQSNGIQTFLRVACDLISETSQNFNQHGLQEWSNLIHNYYIKSKTKYTDYIVPQILELLRSNTHFHQLQFRSIAVFCIHLMSIENYNDFLALYISPIEQLMKINKIQNDESIIFSRCVEDLHSLFYLFRNEIWSLNPKLLTYVAATIYNVYTAVANGVYYLKSKLEDLVFLIFINFSDCKDHLKLIIFSQYQISVRYDDDSGNIQIKYVEKEHQLNLENQVDLILDLIDKRADSKLMKTMFITFLDMYTDVSSNDYSIMEKLFIVKAIHHLIEKDDVQKSISTDPEIVLNFIKSILKVISENNVIDVEVLSIALMVLGCVLENTNKICQFDCIIDYLTKILEIVKDAIFKDLILETLEKIKQIHKISSKQPAGIQRTIDDVLFDTRDPLLPCRSHALMELKKLIESGDKMVLVKKTAILIVIQENLKNTDSYLYLSAIFTLSSLCSYYPNDVLPILCEEYSMPINYNCSPETRLKIGEVLMKTVKSLNETIPLYKNRLLNTFMAGVRDNDHFVRASSLSNLADICRILRFNLGSIIEEIVKCVDYVLRFDPEIEPRRAAVLLLQMIIQGGDSELLQILPDTIKKIYHMLKDQYQYNKDETIKLHAQVAIERLNDIMKSLFLNQNK